MSEETTKPSAAPKSGLAIAALVLGIIAILTSFIPIINNLSAIIAVIGGVLAIVALVGALRGKNSSKGMAIAGIVLAVVSFAVVIATQSAFKSALDKTSQQLKSGEQPVETAQSQSTSNDAGNSGSSSQGQSQEQSQGQASGKDYSHMAVGETVTLESGLSVTVNSVDRSKTKYDGSPLIGVNVTYANNSDKSVSVSVMDWKFEDSNGMQQSCYYSMEDDQLSSGKITTGGTASGNVYFDGEATRILYYSNMFQDNSQIGWNLQ